MINGKTGNMITGKALFLNSFGAFNFWSRK